MTEDFEEKIDEGELAELGINKTEDEDVVVDDAIEADTDIEEKEEETGLYGDAEFERYLAEGYAADE